MKIGQSFTWWIVNFLFCIGNDILPIILKVNGGREGRPIGAYELAKAVEELGAGEILLNCIDCDGENGSLILQISVCCYF